MDQEGAFTTIRHLKIKYTQKIKVKSIEGKKKIKYLGLVESIIIARSQGWPASDQKKISGNNR